MEREKLSVGSEKPTYEDLKQEVERLQSEADELRGVQAEFESRRHEYRETTLQMEQAIEHANQMAAEAEIAGLELSQILNSLTDAICVIDKQFRVLRTNKAFSHFTRQKESDIIGGKCLKILQSPICGTRSCPMSKVIKTKQAMELDIYIRTVCGRTTPFLLTVIPFLGFEGNPIGILAIFKDITERKETEAKLQKANQELTRLTVIDGLTQIANRRHFDTTLELEWRRTGRDKKVLSLILCDVDHFKRYNDANGHQMGDQCLQAIAACIQNSVRRSSDLVARYGGEEFAVILPNTDSDGASYITERIRQAIENLNILHQDSPVSQYVTLSLGVASIMLPKPQWNPDSFLKLADNALYHAKAQGRNRWVEAVIDGSKDK